MLNQARQILEQRFKDQWTLTPVSWANTIPLDATNAPWVRCTVIGGQENPLTIHGAVEESGYVSVQVFVPARSGSGVAAQYADSVAAVFRNYKNGIIDCGLPEKRTVGLDGEWYQINVATPWTAQAT